MNAGIAKLGHVAYRTPDLAESRWFFSEVLGLQVVDETDVSVYLCGLRDRDHHTMSLHADASPGVEHIAWRTMAPEHVETLGTRFEEQGRPVEWLDPGEIESVGEAVKVWAPNGHPFVFYFDVEQPRAPPEKRSKLRNRRYSPHVANRVAPRRIDHCHVQDPNADALADWLVEEFDFRINERFRSDDGTFWGWWMSVTALPHDIGIHRYDEADARFHHVSYHVDQFRDLWDAADICREHGIAPDGGPGKHAITNADFFYVKDPASEIRLELFAGPGYLNFEPDWDPIDWRREEIGTEEDHQWIGTQYTASGTDYVGSPDR